MILYNVTVSVDNDIESQWLGWMKAEHIPNVLVTGCFLGHRILRMLNDQPDATGVTYAVQYELESMAILDHYLVAHAPKLQQDVMIKFGQKCLAFRSVLEEV